METIEEEVMTIREMCDAFDVTPRTLRFYETKELLFPIRQGQKRLFTKRDRARLKLILRGKHFGFNLEKIRQFLELYEEDDGERKQLMASRSACSEKLAELKEEKQRIATVMHELEAHIEWTDTQLRDQFSVREAS